MMENISSNSNREYIGRYLEEVKDICNKIDIDEIDKAIDILFEAWKNDNHVYFMGCGGSASTASHFAGDLSKTTIVKGKKRFKAISLVDNTPVISAWTNDEGWSSVFKGQIENFFKPGDVVVGISVHGGSGKGNAGTWSQNLTLAMQYVKDNGGKCIGLAGFDGGAFKELCDSCITVPKESTPLTEGFHSDIQHLIIFRLRELMEKYESSSENQILSSLKDFVKNCESITNCSEDKIEFFADTASINEIEYCFSKGVKDGITTNPKILESTGDLSLGVESASKNLLMKYNEVPVSLETDLRGIDVKNLEKVPAEKVKEVLLEQAYKIASWNKNAVIKIPVCEGGLLAAKELSEKGIKTNITACMNVYQALRAAEVGIGYVSLFANRMLDCHILELSGYSLDEITTNPNWKDTVKENKEKYFDEAWEIVLKEIAYVSEELDKKDGVGLVIGSIRSPEDIIRIVKAKPQVITVPTKIVEGLVKLSDINYLKTSKRVICDKNIKTSSENLSHPMTQNVLEEFEKAADSYRN